MADRPPLSVVIGTGEGWPYVRDLVRALRPEIEGVSGELLIVDGSGGAAPPVTDLGAHVRWLSRDAASVFALYAIGLREARGEVVATTEDHALPRPGWCAAIVAAHAAHPEAAAIGGAIENGSTDALIQWASYFTTQGPHMAPLGDRVVPMTTNEANVSYKRSAVGTSMTTTDSASWPSCTTDDWPRAERCCASTTAWSSTTSKRMASAGPPRFTSTTASRLPVFGDRTG